MGATSESEDELGLGEEELGEATEEELLARLPAGCTVRRTARQPGSGETAAEELELLRAVVAGCDFMRATPMTPDAHAQYLERRAEFGFQKAKVRGVAERKTMDDMVGGDNALGDFMTEYLDDLMALSPKLFHYFTAINSGLPGGKGAWHSDGNKKYAANPATGPTHRCINHYVRDSSDRKEVGIAFRWERYGRASSTVFIAPPFGCALAIKRTLACHAEIWHNHSGSGCRSLSVLCDVRATFAAMTDGELSAAAAAQPVLADFAFDEGEFKAKGGIGGGAPASPEDARDRQALTAIWGPRGNRVMTKAEAVRRRDAMTAEEKKKARSDARGQTPEQKKARYGHQRYDLLRATVAAKNAPRWKAAVDFYMSDSVKGRYKTRTRTLRYKAALAAATPPLASNGRSNAKLKQMIAEREMIDEQMIEEEEDEVATQHEPVLLRDFFPPTPPTAYSRLAAAASADEPEEIAYIDLVSDSASEDDETEDDETGDALSPTLQKRMERYTGRLVVLPGTRTENLSLAAVRACIASSNFKRRRVFPVSLVLLWVKSILGFPAVKPKIRLMY
eukprot:COSAG06_NODE_1751_length_8472_cov_19.492774_7_plen_563_part_00